MIMGPQNQTKASPGAGSRDARRKARAVEQAGRRRAGSGQRARRRRIWIRAGLACAVAASILLVVFLTGSQNNRGAGYIYQVGQPGPGLPAPGVSLASDMGGRFDLAAQHGKTVLMYFQEGTDCEPCWTQLKAFQHDMVQFRQAGIDEIVSITTDPLGALVQKASDEGVTIAVLSDPDLSVSRRYDANQYGMMGATMDGHTMIVVGPTGQIEWRADYGGAPNYTMYVPDATLLAQMRAGMAKYRAGG
jgi:peroxiredoxin Q/BCP